MYFYVGVVLNKPYYILGEVLSETDANGNTTNYDYDALSRLISVTDPLERITNYVYDGADNITQVIDANGNKVNYEYNTVGLLTKETDALGNVEQYQYYVDGLLEQITKADDTNSSYAYDLAGRMTNVDYSDGTTIDYGYNEVGSTTVMTDKTGTTTYQYDDMQRLISTTDSNNKTVDYTYDVLGRRTSITLPDGQTTNYEYDVLDRLTTVYDGSDILAEYEYNANSQLISNVRNDITAVYEYNELGQITQLTTSDINEQMQKFSYQYDAIGNIVEEVRTEQDSINTRSYSYDSANQLVEFSDNEYIEKYAYDSVGNMISKDINGALTSYAYNGANQLTAETFEEQTIQYIYNQNGDSVEKSSGEQYTYDIQGNLTSIVGNGINQSFTYNGNGNRLSKTVDGETTYYVNDLNQRYEQVVQTYNDEGVIDTYTYGLQRIDSKGETNETYLYDGRGSVTGTLNADNEFVSYRYTAYGELMPNSPTPKVFGYNAEATDYETGMQYLRARYYDTGVQRFVNEDAWRGNYETPKSLNRYGYTFNNPVMYADDGGNRPVELTEVNTHTMQQVVKTTKADLEKEAKEKKDAEIAQAYEDYYRNSLNVPAEGPYNNTSSEANVKTPEQTLEEVIGNCSFDQINAMIYDDMDFSIYSIAELQSLYDRIDALDVGKKAFDNVNNKNKFMRQLKRYIKDNTPLTNEQATLKNEGTWSIVAGAAAVALAVTAAIVAAPVAAIGLVAIGVVGAVSIGLGAASINEANTGDNWIKDNIFFGNETAYNTAQALAFVGSVAGAITLAPIVASVVAGTKLWQAVIGNDKGTVIRTSGSGTSTSVSIGPSTSSTTQTTTAAMQVTNVVDPEDLVDDTPATTGGAYGQIAADGGQRHHMPANSVSTYSTGSGPAIRMETSDHMQTASWGSSSSAIEYRQTQQNLIDQGKFLEAQQMDIADVQNLFGDKYDTAISQMVKYTKELINRNK